MSLYIWCIHKILGVQARQAQEPTHRTTTKSGGHGGPSNPHLLCYMDVNGLDVVNFWSRLTEALKRSPNICAS